ncbi:hypothetical protein CEXT_28511 [Caerostris extrusa]|uniref:Uncharacterized protein n=1 Tax=Caerostris extrusa TaxID=172846 RepID=A0AAV4PR56_CAEEX|nr:hypothetical protein CEXT_28511 [Caerostris extrusa]
MGNIAQGPPATREDEMQEPSLTSKNGTRDPRPPSTLFIDQKSSSSYVQRETTPTPLTSHMYSVKLIPKPFAEHLCQQCQNIANSHLESFEKGGYLKLKNNAQGRKGEFKPCQTFILVELSIPKKG